MRRTKIISTFGPSIADSEILKNVLITLALTLVIIYFKVTSEFIYFQF